MSSCQSFLPPFAEQLGARAERNRDAFFNIEYPDDEYDDDFEMDSYVSDDSQLSSFYVRNRTVTLSSSDDDEADIVRVAGFFDGEERLVDLRDEELDGDESDDGQASGAEMDSELEISTGEESDDGAFPFF